MQNKIKRLDEWLREGPFILSLSSGFFAFFAHCGMISILEDENIIPKKITGSSAGGLIGAFWASGCSSNNIKDKIFILKKEEFWDPSFGFGLLKGVLFRNLVKDFVPINNLEDCPIPVAISVFDIFSRKTHVLNNGLLSDAVYATCAVPIMFQPIKINGHYYLDGGLKDRPGLAGAELNSRVFHHHILSNSPWRKKKALDLQIPKRNNIVSLIIDKLPRVSPNQLNTGTLAYEKARIATRLALKKKVIDDKVYI